MLEIIISIIFVLIGVAFCYCWWYGSYYKDFFYKTIIYNQNTKKVVKIINANTSIPKSHPLLQIPHIQLTLIKEKSQINQRITFVTDHQVISNFDCNINLKIKETDELGLQAIFDFLNSHGEIQIGKRIHVYHFQENEVFWEYPVIGMLCDFCKKHLTQIKKLDNPFDDEQREEFNNLIRAHLDPLLSGSNIEIESNRFSLS